MHSPSKKPEYSTKTVLLVRNSEKYERRGHHYSRTQRSTWRSPSFLPILVQIWKLLENTRTVQEPYSRRDLYLHPNRIHIHECQLVCLRQRRNRRVLSQNTEVPDDTFGKVQQYLYYLVQAERPSRTHAQILAKSIHVSWTKLTDWYSTHRNVKYERYPRLY